MKARGAGHRLSCMVGATLLLGALGAAPPEFSSEPLDDGTRARMTHSWRPGCPVPLEDLRLLRVSHQGFEGGAHVGELVVHADQAEAVLAVMRTLYEAGFPIERMALIDEYGGDDDRSMAANNTSAFNCRSVAGRPGVWSEHSYGRAIDINPIQNPYVSASGTVSPPGGAAYTDRTRLSPGMVVADDGVVQAFAGIGWQWGGDWTSAKDYQHFSASGH
jgi:hypothetical protein